MAGPRRHQKAQCKKCKGIQWRTVHDAPPGQLPTFLHKRCKKRRRTPLTDALEAAKAQCGGLKNLLRALAERGVTISWGPFFAWMNGAIPEEPEKVGRALAGILAYPADEPRRRRARRRSRAASTERLLEFLQRFDAERRARFAKARAAHTKWVECAGLCGRRALRRLVRKQEGFQRTGRWTCGGCRKKASKVPIVCERESCTNLRWDYETKRVKALPTRRLRADRLVSGPDGAGVVRFPDGSLVRVRKCRLHHLRDLGAVARAKAREALFTGKFTTKRKDARGRPLKGRPTKKLGFDPWYERRPQSERLMDPDGEPRTALEVRDLARGADVANATEQERARAEEIQAEWYSQLLKRRASEARGARTRPSPALEASSSTHARRGRGYGVHGLNRSRLAAAARKSRRCPLDGLVVGAGSWFHQGCFNVWASSQDYTEALRRPWTCECGRSNPPGTRKCPGCRTPLLPPIPPWFGHLTTEEGFQQKYTLCVRHFVWGEPIHALATEYVRKRWPALGTSDVVKKAEQYRGNVLDDIRDFSRWLSSDLMLNFPSVAMRKAIGPRLALLRAQPDPKRRQRDLGRIGWLGLRFGMTPAAIALRVIGFSAPEILRLLQTATTDPVPGGSDAEQVRNGALLVATEGGVARKRRLAERVRNRARLAAVVVPIVATEGGVAREKKRRLTPEEIRAIRAAPAESGVNIRLSRQYGVSPTHICAVRRRRAHRVDRSGTDLGQHAASA